MPALPNGQAPAAVYLRAPTLVEGDDSCGSGTVATVCVVSCAVCAYVRTFVYAYTCVYTCICVYAYICVCACPVRVLTGDPRRLTAGDLIAEWPYDLMCVVVVE